MNAHAHRPRPARRRRWAAVALTLAAGPLLAPAASAEQSAGVEYVANDQYVLVEHQYGAVAPAARRIPVDTTTRNIEVELWYPSTGGVTECDFLVGNRVEASATWTRREWEELPHVLPVPAGLVQPVPGTLYGVVCQGRDAPSGDSARWTLVEDESVGGLRTITAADDDRLLTDVVDNSFYYQDDDEQVGRTAHPGDRVSVRLDVFAPDTWAPTPGATTLTAQLTPRGGSPVAMQDPAVSADGHVFSFTIPATLPAELLGRDEVYVSADTVRPGSDTTAGYRRLTRWHERVDIVVRDATSSTRLALAQPYAFTVRPGKASVAVRSGGQPVTSGTVDVSVDGKVVRSVTLTPSTLGRATVRLPALPRGRHTVTARYDGSGSVQPSLSRPAGLHVLG